MEKEQTMPMTFQMKEGEVAMIVFTFADHARNEFIDLAAYGFATQEAFDEHWAMLSEIPKGDDTSFLADEHTEQGLERTKLITVEAIEGITGRPIADLIEEGRAALSKVLNDWTAERATRRSA